MRSAGPGFTLALPPPVAAFRSHPEGRSLAALRHPAARLGPRLCLHPPPGSSLCTSWKCEGGCHCSRLHRTLPPAAHGAGPPPLSGPLRRSLACTLGKQEHALTRWAACQGASPSSPGGSSKVPGVPDSPFSQSCSSTTLSNGAMAARLSSGSLPCAILTPPGTAALTAPQLYVSPPVCCVSKHPPAMSSKHLRGSGPASKEQRDRLTFIICPPVWVCSAQHKPAGSASPQLQKAKSSSQPDAARPAWLQQTFIRISEGGHG